MGYLSTNGTTADGYCTTSFGPNVAQSVMLCGAPSSDSMDSDSAEFHPFCFFNTGPSIPDDAIPTKVKFSCRVTSIQGDPAALQLRAHIGDDIIGSSLQKTDYGDVIADGEMIGQMTTTTGAKSVESTHVDILDQVSLDAYTNIEIDAWWTGSAGSSGVIATIATQENATSAYRPVLEVWYDEVISITKSLQYAIKSSQQVSKGLSYAIRTIQSATKALAYKIKSSQPVTKALTYFIKSQQSENKTLKYAIRTIIGFTKALGYAIRTINGITKGLLYKVKSKVTINKTLKYTVKAITSSESGVVLGTKNGKPVLIAKGHKTFFGTIKNKSVIPSDKPNTIISSNPSKSVIINKDNKTQLNTRENKSVISSDKPKSILTSRNSANVVKSNKESVATLGTKKPKTII